jgi:hypothetical protein
MSQPEMLAAISQVFVKGHRVDTRGFRSDKLLLHEVHPQQPDQRHL